MERLQKLLEDLSNFNIKVENILNQKKESFAESFKAENRLYSFRDPGIKFSIGYSINL